jgi:hypothetical protein
MTSLETRIACWIPVSCWRLPQTAEMSLRRHFARAYRPNPGIFISV